MVLRALPRVAGAQIGQQRAQHAEVVEALVLVELRVLGRQETRAWRGSARHVNGITVRRSTNRLASTVPSRARTRVT